MNSRVRIQGKKFSVVIIFLFLLLFSSSFVYGQWDLVNPSYLSPNWHLFGVHFTSPTEGWAVGLDNTNQQTGILLHYSWGTWSLVTLPYVSPGWDLRRVHFASASNGWAVGYDWAKGGGVLLHYSKGKWTSVTPPPVSTDWDLEAIHFTSAG